MKWDNRQFSRMKTLLLTLSLTVFPTVCFVGCGNQEKNVQENNFQLIGQTDDGVASVAFAQVNGRWTGYVCNNTNTGEWFDANATTTIKELSSDAGATIVLNTANDFSQGTFVSSDGANHGFKTTKAVGDQGLFRLSGQELVARPPAGERGISLEAIINNAVVQSIKVRVGISETSKFSAGWILGDNDSIVGNVTVKRTGVSPVGNQLPLSRQVVAGTSLSVLHPVDKGAPAVPNSDNSCNAEISSGGCDRAVARNAILVSISNATNSALNWDSEYVNDLLAECAEFLTTYCS